MLSEDFPVWLLWAPRPHTPSGYLVIHTLLLGPINTLVPGDFGGILLQSVRVDRGKVPFQP